VPNHVIDHLNSLAAVHPISSEPVFHFRGSNVEENEDPDPLNDSTAEDIIGPVLEHQDRPLDLEDYLPGGILDEYPVLDLPAPISEQNVDENSFFQPEADYRGVQ